MSLLDKLRMPGGRPAKRVPVDRVVIKLSVAGQTLPEWNHRLGVSEKWSTNEGLRRQVGNHINIYHQPGWVVRPGDEGYYATLPEESNEWGEVHP